MSGRRQRSRPRPRHRRRGDDDSVPSPDEQIDGLTRRIQTDPTNSQLYLMRGGRFYKLLDAVSAKKDFHSAESLHRNSETAFQLGRVYTRFGLDYTKGLKCLNESLHRLATSTKFDSSSSSSSSARPDPSVIESKLYKVHYWLARTHECLFNYDEALKSYEKALMLRPEDPRCLFDLGRYYFAHEVNWRQSLEYLNRVLQLEPDHLLALCEKARVWNNMGKGTEAIELVTRAIRIADKMRKKLIADEGLVYRVRNDRRVRDVIRSDRAYPYIVLSKTYKDRGDVQKSIHALEQAAECPISEYYALSCLKARLGFMKMSVGSQAEAHRDFEDSSVLLNAKDFAHAQLARYYRILYDYQVQTQAGQQPAMPAAGPLQRGILEARFRQECIALNPSNPYIHLYIGNFYKNKVSDLRRAIHYYDTAVRLNPRCSLGFYNLAETYETLRDSENAVRCARLAAEINTEDHYSMELAGDQFLVQRKYEEALGMYSGAITHNHPKRMVYYVSRAQACLCLGRVDDAVADLCAAYRDMVMDAAQFDRSDALVAEVERCTVCCFDEVTKEEVARRRLVLEFTQQQRQQQLEEEEEEEGETESESKGESKGDDDDDFPGLRFFRFVVPRGSQESSFWVHASLLCCSRFFFTRFRDISLHCREIVLTIEDESYVEAMEAFVQWVYGLPIAEQVYQNPKTFVRVCVLGEIFQLLEIEESLASAIGRKDQGQQGQQGGATVPPPHARGVQKGREVRIDDVHAVMKVLVEACMCSTAVSSGDESVLSMKSVPTLLDSSVDSSCLRRRVKFTIPPLFRLILKCLEFFRDDMGFLQTEIEQTSDDEIRDCLERTLRLAYAFKTIEDHPPIPAEPPQPHPTLVRRATLPLLGGEIFCFHGRLRLLHNSMLLPNLKLISTDGHGFNCHREILMMRSEFFHRMFSSGFRESAQSTISMKVSGVVLRVILQHLYGMSVSGAIQSIVLQADVVSAADMFLLKDLERLCRMHEAKAKIRKARTKVIKKPY